VLRRLVEVIDGPDPARCIDRYVVGRSPAVHVDLA
jgi:hypothetical protein